MAPRPIIIDTDPGQDDAVAILLALAAPEALAVLGLTIVAGNVSLAQTVRNARKICELAGRPEIRVFAGCARPLILPPITAEHVHGAEGLDGPDLPEPTMPVQPGHAVDFLIETLMAADDDGITLCPIGPLTNIALALVKEPLIRPRIAEIVLMGGGFFQGGNITPAAEFNIHSDPHAAEIVFDSGVPITMMPLDVTRQILVTPERTERLRALGTRVGMAVADLLDAYDGTGGSRYGTEGRPLHDPCVIAYLLQPSLFTGRRVNVAIETTGRHTLGMTVVDWRGVTGTPPNALVINQGDAEGFFALLTDRLARL